MGAVWLTSEIIGEVKRKKVIKYVFAGHRE
jgi:hypothetical protein